MSGAGNQLNYDYRDPRHVERYNRLVVRNRDGSTEGTRAAAIEVAQRVLIDVAERETRHEWRHGETIAVRVVDVGG